MSGQEDIIVEITRRKWRWVSHVLRKDQHDIARETIFWIADGKRKRGPKATWQRTTMSELKLCYHGEQWQLEQRTELAGRILSPTYMPHGTKKKVRTKFYGKTNYLLK
jgi:hypothetical protein